MCSIGGHENGWPLTKWITVSTRNAKDAEPSPGGLSYQIRATEWRRGWKRRVTEGGRDKAERRRQSGMDEVLELSRKERLEVR